MPGVEAIGLGGADVTVKVSDAGVDPATHGVLANGFIFQNALGSVVPDALQGRLPVAPDEIALGSQTLDSLHKKIGDTVALEIANFVKLKFRIVGVVVVPPFSSTARLGQGTMFNFSAASRVQGAPPPNVMWIRFASSRAKRDALAAIRRAAPDVTVYGTPTPDDIVNLGKLTTLPLVLAGLLALLAAATLAHAIVTAVRRRRRDLAILKTLGFVRGQVRRTVAWQAGSLVIIPMIVALPAGIAIGRELWNLLASQLGIHPEPLVPALSVGLIAPAAIVLALLVAWLPSRVAARTPPALVLRTE
jgi:ABC-type antimicrobial peptide transport system permease subunit